MTFSLVLSFVKRILESCLENPRILESSLENAMFVEIDTKRRLRLVGKMVCSEQKSKRFSILLCDAKPVKPNKRY